MNKILQHIAAPLMTRSKIEQLDVYKEFDDGAVTYVDKQTQTYFNVTSGGTTSWYVIGHKAWHRTLWGKIKQDGLVLANLFTHQKTKGVTIDISFMNYFFFLTLSVLGVLL